MKQLKPFDISDLEDILKEIRLKVMRYKREKHELQTLDIQDLLDDLSILRVQLADIGADLYGWKIESAAKYENDRLKREEEIENQLNEDKKKDKKITNVADRAKRKAKLETSPDDMIYHDKLNRLAINLYQYSLPDVIYAMRSRISIRVRGDAPVNVKQDYRPESNDDGFADYFSNDERRVIAEVDNLEREI